MELVQLESNICTAWRKVQNGEEKEFDELELKLEQLSSLMVEPDLESKMEPNSGLRPGWRALKKGCQVYWDAQDKLLPGEESWVLRREGRDVELDSRGFVTARVLLRGEDPEWVTAYDMEEFRVSE